MDTVARWHPWPTKKGLRHTLSLWKNHSIWSDDATSVEIESAEHGIEVVSRSQLYTFCNDPMDWSEFMWSDDLLLSPQSDVYVQKQGKVVAVRVKTGRYCGFFIPARSWGFAVPNFEMIDIIRAVFEQFQIEAITPSSLSEKVLRWTLGEKISIFRPSVRLRDVLLTHNGGSRIDLAEEERFYKRAYKYDRHKAFLSFAYAVPDPHFPPKYHVRPGESWLYDYATPGFWKVTMVAHGCGIHPIFLPGEGRKRYPREGEQFTRWLWRDEILACEQKGYTLLFIHEGYRWTRTSDFLQPWADLLWDKFQLAKSGEEERIIKSMMVGFFGRCLREPTNHFLVPMGEQKQGDTPILHTWVEHLDNWQGGIEGKKFFTNWYLRAEYNEESTALTPIGAWVIAQCRLEMFRLAAIEEARGNKLISSYIDSCVFERRASALSLGPLPGQYSEEIFQNVWAIRNALIPDDEKKMRAPGYQIDSEERHDFWKKYHRS